MLLAKYFSFIFFNVSRCFSLFLCIWIYYQSSILGQTMETGSGFPCPERKTQFSGIWTWFLPKSFKRRMTTIRTSAPTRMKMSLRSCLLFGGGFSIVSLAMLPFYCLGCYMYTSLPFFPFWASRSDGTSQSSSSSSSFEFCKPLSSLPSLRFGCLSPRPFGPGGFGLYLSTGRSLFCESTRQHSRARAKKIRNILIIFCFPICNKYRVLGIHWYIKKSQNFLLILVAVQGLVGHN